MAKVTSDHVSSIAGRYLGRSRPMGIDPEFWSDIQSMAASALSQDETPSEKKASDFAVMAFELERAGEADLAMQLRVKAESELKSAGKPVLHEWDEDALSK